MVKTPLLVLVPVLLWLGTSAPQARADAVRLHIVGPDQKSVAGASVRVLETSGTWADRKTEPLRDFSSDESGKVAFEAKNPLAAPTKNSPLENQHLIYVRVMAPGMAVASRLLKTNDNEIVLQSGQKWGGVALDALQQPVGGVKVVLGGWGAAKSKEGAEFAVYLPKELQLETVTAPDGTWSFPDVAREGRARIGVQDPRFVPAELTLPLDAMGAPPIFLERGAVIKGRLLRPDGAPAAGVRLYPGGSNRVSMDEDLRTASDGRFELFGLRAGDYYVQNISFGNSKPLPFILEPKSVAALQTGEIRDLGDWKTAAGVLVRGKIVENGGKKPLEGALARTWGRSDSNGTADKNGVFAFHIAEDNSQVSISAPGFIEVQKTLPTAVQGAIDLGTVELTRGIGVTGTFKDQNGKDVTNQQISVEETRSHAQHYGYVSGGKFSFDALGPGEYTLKSEGLKIVSDPKFSVVANQKPALIEIVVARTLAVTPRFLVGRAVDGEGKPVAGARISLRITGPSRTYQSVEAVSGLDGRFDDEISLEGAIPKILAASRPGLLFVGGDFKIVDGIWQADLSFQERGAMLRGRVVDSDGRPAAGAYVSLVGRNDQPIVQSDENGAFSLPDVALQGVTIVASNGRGYGEVAVAKAGEKVEVALQKAADYDATALADEIFPTARMGDMWGERWEAAFDTLGTTRIEAAMTRAKAGSRNWDWTWNRYLEQLARRDPASFLARGEQLIAQMSADGKGSATARLMLLRARSTDPDALASARAWLASQKAIKREMTGDSVVPLLQIAAVADALKSDDAAFWLDYAAQIAGQQPEKTRFSDASEWGGAAAEIGPRAVENLLQEWNAAAKMKALSGALTTSVERKGLEAARGALAQMAGLEAEAMQIAAQNDVRAEEGFPWKPKDALAQASGELAGLLAQTDPRAAREMLKTVPEYDQSDLLLAIAKNAGRLGQTDLAATALREVFEVGYANVEPRAAAAQIALGFNAQLADELFAKTWQSSKPGAGIDEDFGYQPSVAAYAGARAQKWAGQSRILIEREWAERLKAYKAPENNNYDNSAEILRALVRAMAKIDARRALEMAALLPGKDTAKATARGQIAVALLEKS